jgi:hypothetical protein
MKLLALIVSLLLCALLSGCNFSGEYPMAFSVSGDIKTEGMEQPVRVEWTLWRAKMSGKKVVRNVQP